MTSLPLPTCIPRYVSPKALRDWFGHLAFGHDLASAIQPSLYVALEGASGDAYFGICQTVAEKGLECTCYGVLLSADTSESSDAANLALYNANYYASFSHLLSSGEESIRSFSDNSIDLLQIASNQNVEELFNDWLPKVKPGGLILVDRITMRDPASEAWRLWERIEGTFHESFAFHHANGLGVMRKPAFGPSSSPFLELLFNGSAEDREYVRRHYVVYSGYLDGILRKENATNALDVQIQELTTELRAAQHERMILEADLAHRQLAIAQLQFALTQTQNERNEAKRTIASLQDSLAAAETAHSLQKEQLAEALQSERQAREDIVRSLSWKITAPARDFMEWFRRRKAD